MQEQYKKNVWEKSDDEYSLSIRVQIMINHISISFLPQCQRQENVFLRAPAEKGIVWHIDTRSVVWTVIHSGKLAIQIAR